MHDGKVHRSGLKLIMRHHFYPLQFLHCNSTNQELYNGQFYPFVEQTLRNKSDCTVLFYGQTGTGKTYTMTSLQECLFNSILGQESMYNHNSNVQRPTIKFGFFEIHFKKCYDLLNQRAECKLQTGSNGQINVSNNVYEVSSFEE